ncbi:hypothetical protein Vi05172_g4162 [Venturia inaequalis]|nr:hypothetical protein Vi05172_g4162 [Venturia inaequalis]
MDGLWYPRPNSGCHIAIQRYGDTCATWAGTVVMDSCKDFEPIKRIGTVKYTTCPDF